MNRAMRDLSRFGRFADLLDAGWVPRSMALETLGVSEGEFRHLLAEGRVQYRSAGRLKLYRIPR
jgi:hypothetical protein